MRSPSIVALILSALIAQSGAALAQAGGQPGGIAPPAAPQGGEVVEFPSPIGAGVPREDIMETMVKSALVTFNDANLSGNYAVMHARLHPAFRGQVSAERLAEIFSVFRTKKINLVPILVHKVVYTSGPAIDSNGLLVANGYLDTRPWRTNFELSWRRAAGEWMLWKINVRVRPPEQ